MRARLVVSCCILLILPAEGDTAAQTPRWTAREVLRVGTVDGPGALAGVFDAEFAPDGRILVAQRDIGLAEFGPDGTYRRTLGRKGPGPGEFTFMSRLGWKGDTLWAVDIDRLNVFNADLRFVQTITPRLEDPPAAMRVFPGPLMADGSMLFISVTVEEDAVPIILTDRTGKRLRVLARGTDAPRRWLIRPAGTLPVSTADPWPSNTMWLHDPSGRSIIVVDRRNEDAPDDPVFHVLRIALDGDTVARASIRYPPREIGDDMADAFFRERAESIGTRPGITAAAAESMLRDVVVLPPHMPPVTKLVPASDGTTWLRREDMRQATVEWQVLDREFNEIARATLPSDLEVFRITGDRILGRVTDDLDVPFVVILEVVGDPGQENGS
jgi:hypothetical protein